MNIAGGGGDGEQPAIRVVVGSIPIRPQLAVEQEA